MLRISFILSFIVMLAACDNLSTPTPRTTPFEPYAQDVVVGGDMRQTPPQINTPPTASAQGKVAILLPLTGAQSAIGQSMLNAAQMALFDVNDAEFELLPFDTKGTSSGAAEAVRLAGTQNVKMILGPLLADETQSAGATARPYNLQVIGFTTDSSRLGGNVSTLGILPYDQGERMANFARQSNLKNIVAIAPNDAYANIIVSSFQSAAAPMNIRIVDKIIINSGDNANQIAAALATKRGQFDGILMPMGNPVIANLARALNDNGLGANAVAWLGTGLWDDASVAANPAMQGAFYAAPPTQQRQTFDNQYRTIFNETPHRLASLGYDATALAIVLLRQNQSTRPIDRMAIMNPNGFAGIDGIFRFRANGMAERGLAVYKIIGGGQTSVIAPAPNSFVN